MKGKFVLKWKYKGLEYSRTYDNEFAANREADVLEDLGREILSIDLVEE